MTVHGAFRRPRAASVGLGFIARWLESKRWTAVCIRYRKKRECADVRLKFRQKDTNQLRINLQATTACALPEIRISVRGLEAADRELPGDVMQSTPRTSPRVPLALGTRANWPALALRGREISGDPTPPAPKLPPPSPRPNQLWRALLGAGVLAGHELLRRCCT